MRDVELGQWVLVSCVPHSFMPAGSCGLVGRTGLQGWRRAPPPLLRRTSREPRGDIRFIF